MTPVISLINKESGELVRSGRGLAWLTTIALVLSGFSLLLVGNTELSLLDNAQAVYMMMGTVTALGCLLAVAIGSDAVAGERERGTLVPLLVTPLSTDVILTGKMGGLAVSWLMIYLISLPYLWAVGSSGQNLLPALIYLAMLGTPVVLGFGFYALMLSARMTSVRSALATSLITLIFLGAPLVLGPGLRQSRIGKAIDMINPVAAAFNSYDSVVIDSQPLSDQAVRLAIILIWLILTFLGARRAMRSLRP